MEKDENYQKIIEGLTTHSSLKRQVYQNTVEVFQQFKAHLKELSTHLILDFNKVDSTIEIEYADISKYEVRIRFGGDVLIITMHTNIFTFPPEHLIFKTSYVNEDPSRVYCGVIHIHNFLTDSLKFNRLHDIGYLLGRIFINKDKHFFAEGKGQLNFLYDNIIEQEMNDTSIDKMIKLAINYCFEFELQVPPFNDVDEITLIDKQLEFANSGYQTGKLIGYKFKAQQEGKVS